jgi:hypothetical protein
VFPVKYGLTTQGICVSCEVRTAHTMYLYVPYGSHGKQRRRRDVFPLRYGLTTQCICVSCGVRTAHTVHLCVPYGSHGKQRVFTHTALTSWILYRRRDVFPVRYGLTTQCICVSCGVQTAHTVYLRVPYGSHSKQRLFPHTALTGCAL